jgi:6,7-dimethyl-8-ribityllumazine synthase
MVTETSSAPREKFDFGAARPHILIVDARFYVDISDELKRGAVAVLEAAGATHDNISVPGVLEIPAAIAMAAKARTGKAYDGFVALGCVIRGETTHYDIVSTESARAIMDLSINGPVAVGNGILTVETVEQAWARARVGEGDKGGGAAEAALVMVRAARHFGAA